MTDPGGRITNYTYDKRGLLTNLTDGSDTFAFNYDAGGRRVSLAYPNGVAASYDYDAAGQVAQTYEYDSFGNITNQTGNVENPFTYTGREYDAETGLYFYRARYYDAMAGRFINEDPIGFWGGINLFRYVGNSPIKFKDTLGLYNTPADWYIVLPANFIGWALVKIPSPYTQIAGWTLIAISTGYIAYELYQVSRLNNKQTRDRLRKSCKFNNYTSQTNHFGQ